MYRSHWLELLGSRDFPDRMCEPAASDVDQEPEFWSAGESMVLVAVVVAASGRPQWAFGGILLGFLLLLAWKPAHDEGDCPAYWSDDVSTFEGAPRN